jgi:ABC-type lipoprotein release transport system permease subunit
MSFEVSQIVTHGIYEKDMRIVYMALENLQEILGSGRKVNVVALKTSPHIGKSTQAIKEFSQSLNRKLNLGFYAKPYWSDFSTLIEAVQVQKLIIGLILQLVVVISIFNVLAFIIFLNEKKAQEIFLFKALGMSQRRVYRTWMAMVLAIWFGSCLLSLGFVEVFDMALRNMGIFQLPGDVYHLGQLTIILDGNDYIIVFGLALLWLVFMSWLGLRRMKTKTVLAGLRREFA